MFSILNVMLLQPEGPLPKEGVSEHFFLDMYELRKAMFSVPVRETYLSLISHYPTFGINRYHHTLLRFQTLNLLDTFYYKVLYV